VEQNISFRQSEETLMSTSVRVSNPTTPVRASSSWRWLAFTAACLAAVMDLLDSTIAQVAAPAIRADLGGSYAVIEWVTAGYTLAMAVGLLTGGRLGDLYGRKRVLLFGIAGFMVASAACAAAVNPGQLIAARAVQGAVGALMIPQVLGLIRDLFPAEQMTKAIGVYGPVMGLSAMLGPIVAGGLIGADLFGTNWRMIFLVNLPIGAFALITGAKLLPSVRDQQSRARLDIPSALVAGAGMFLLVYPLVEGRALSWPPYLFAMMAASVVVLAGFGWYQLRRQRAGATPLVDPEVFRNRSYTSGLLFALVFISALGGIVLIFNVFLQEGLGFSPWHSAISTAPWAGGAFIGAAVAGMTLAKLGRRIVHIGLVIETVGLVGVILVLRTLGPQVSTLDLLAPMIVGGLGMGMVFVPLFDIILADVSPKVIGSASGVLQTINSLAMALGVAGLGAVFFDLLSGGSSRGQVFSSAAQWTSALTIGLLVASFVLGFWMPRHAREPGEAQTTGTEPASELAGRH
jgi:EmrB/QacA subfamily drug resistance transporter